MDEPTLDSEYLKLLKPQFLELFKQFVKPSNVISLFHKYNINVLTENDVVSSLFIPLIRLLMKTVLRSFIFTHAVFLKIIGEHKS